ncbi:MAG: NADH-quinone oxidoreductase subunit I [Muribaculaceae bacterium]|nr:NADH-quinone oxidoreductase subunit I [Muribaculaceae bacterium]
MGSVKDYFQSLGSGVLSLLKGMQVTGKEFVTPKITERYPEDRETFKWPERFRAILELIYDKDGNHKCIACGTCERNCPNGTITIESKMVDTPAGTKKKKLARYIYDLGSCTFCQLCVTTCPTNALRFSNDFEQSVFTRSKLVKQLNYLPEKPEPELTEEEKAKLAAEKEAKIAAAKAKAAALKAEREKAAGAPAAEAAPAPAAPKADDAAAKALAAAKGDPEKEAKIRAALERAAALKAQREAAKSNEEGK